MCARQGRTGRPTGTRNISLPLRGTCCVPVPSNVRRHEYLNLPTVPSACSEQHSTRRAGCGVPNLWLCAIYLRVCDRRDWLAPRLPINLHQLRHYDCDCRTRCNGSACLPCMREQDFHMPDRSDPDVPPERVIQDSTEGPVPKESGQSQKRAFPGDERQCQWTPHDQGASFGQRL